MEIATNRKPTEKKATVLIHNSYGSGDPEQGEPWIIVRIVKYVSSSSWGISGEVRCDLKLEDINPDVVTTPGSIKGNMGLRLKGRWSRRDITSAANMVTSCLANILFNTALKAKEAGVVELLR
ncbi:MAG: hypothetical protein A3F35_02945 [Candidatus Woykebacteria bacterium RIFCSPHIGHO2_12_FULL_45_10]|uniref:Uncharacterized protein n=1 Tax=Candidatus Woykebacteria bacterium RIFCSPHIGHO2_12_FULL_45_10 TaxID=1802603 RepID=A0A1G1WRK6_9BACT|nr:MAG: hypothetical protein A3F35_02945 [Candidatus Woykebacteria bacterium RIFCSPHIGHO2_12_FULL_45_10]